MNISVDIVNYLRSNLTDPAGRTNSSTGKHWIYTNRPQFTISELGLPLIFTGFPLLVPIGKLLSGGHKQRATYSLNIYSKDASQIETLSNTIRSKLLHDLPKKVSGISNVEIVSSNIYPNIIDDLDVWLLNITFSYVFFEVL